MLITSSMSITADGNEPDILTSSVRNWRRSSLARRNA
nr:MAG TPA: hypothetical protein [Caudoviricetes sp.]